MTPEMEDRFQALANFMEWVDPHGDCDTCEVCRGHTPPADEPYDDNGARADAYERSLGL